MAEHEAQGEGGEEYEHDHEGHDHPHEDHDHALIVDQLPAGRWRVDPGSSEVSFRTRALFGLLPVNGFFDTFSGDLDVDDDGRATGSFVVDTATLTTGVRRRDEDLKSEAYFHAAQHPHMTFRLDSVQASGEDHLNVTGELTIRDTKIPLSFPAHAIRHGDHLHLEGRVTIDHHAAGLGWAKPGMVGKTVRADVALTLNPAD